MENDMSIVRRFSEQLPVNVAGLIRELDVDYYEIPMPAANSGRIEKRGDDFSIFVNANEGPQRKRFTAAHELAHFLLHRDLLPEGTHLDRLFNPQGYEETDGCISPYHEVQANQFAANLLMPSIFLRENYDRAQDNYAWLAEKCAVSKKAMRIRLKSLGLRPTAA